MKNLKNVFLALNTSILLMLIGCGGGSNDSPTNETETNQAPTANAGTDKSIIVNQSITLLGIGSDSDGSIINYEWKKGDDLLSTTTQFNYTPTMIGTEILTFTVTDDDGLTDTDEVTITVNEINEENNAPIANAGEDKSVIVNQSITLIGSGTDSDGSISNYEWKKDNRILATTSEFNYTPTVIGSHTLTLTVTDNEGLKSNSDSMTIIVNSSAIPITNGNIDMAEYLPNQSMTKNYIDKFKFKSEDTGEIETTKEEITVNNNVVSFVTTYSNDSTVDTDVYTINQSSIVQEWDVNRTTTRPRHVDIGDITLDYKTINIHSQCTLLEKLTNFSHGGYNYSGDIIKEKCTGYGVLYVYSKKGLGVVAAISNPGSTFDYSNSYYTD